MKKDEKKRLFSKKVIKKTLIIGIIGFLILLILFGLVLVNDWGLTFIAEQATPLIREKSGYQLEMDKVSGSIFKSLTVERPILLNGLTGDTLLTADHIRIDYKLSRLIRDERMVDRVRIEQPRVWVTQDNDGNLNWLIPSPDPAPADSTPSQLSIKVNEIRIHDGRVRVVMPDLPIAGTVDNPLRINEIDFSASVSVSPQGQEVENLSLRLDIPQADIRLQDFEVTARVTQRTAIIDTLFLLTDRSHIAGSFTVRLDSLSITGRVASDSITIDEFAYFIPDSLDISGQCAFDFQLAGHLDQRIAAQGKIILPYARYDQYECEKMVVELSYQEQLLHVHDLYGIVNTMYLKGDFQLDMSVDPSVYRGNISFSKFNPMQFIPTGMTEVDLNGNIGGKIGFQGIGMDPETLSGAVTIQLDSNSRINRFPVAKLDADIRWVEQRLLIDNFQIASYSARISLTGDGKSPAYFSPTDRELSMRIDGKQLDLAHFKYMLKNDGIAGVCAFDIQVDGSLDSPSVKGEVRLDNCCYDSLTVREISGYVQVTDVMRSRIGEARLHIQDLKFGNFLIDRIDTFVKSDGPQVRIDSLAMAISDTVYARLDANLTIDGKNISGEIPSLLFHSPIFQAKNPYPLTFSATPDKARIEDFGLDSTLGDLELYGSYDFNGDINMEARLFGLNLTEIGKLAALPSPLSGEISLDIGVNGVLDEISMVTAIRGKGLGFDKFPLGDLNGTVAYADKKLAIPWLTLNYEDQNTLITGYIPVNLLGSGIDPKLMEEGMRFEIDMRNQSLDAVNVFLPEGMGVHGTWDAYLTAEDRIMNPEIMGELTLNAEFSDSIRGFSLSELTADVLIDNELISINSLVVQIGQESRIVLSGEIETAIDRLLHDSQESAADEPPPDLPVIPIEKWDISIEANDFNIADIHVNALEESKIKPTGNMTLLTRLTGDPYHPMATTFIHISDVGTGGPSMGDLDLYGYYDSEQAVLDSLTLFYKESRRAYAHATIPLPITPILRGDSLKIENISAFLQAYYLDLPNITSMLPDILVSRGYVNANISVEGDMPHPTIQGDFGLQDGSLKLAATNTDFSDMKLVGEIVRDTLFIHEFSSQTAPNGHVLIKGWAAIGDFDFPNTDIAITARKFSVENVGDISSVVDVDMHITGPAVRTLCSGEVSIIDGLLTVPFEEEQSASTTASTKMLWEFPLDLDLKMIGPSIWLRNRQADIEMQLDMDAWTGKNLLYLAGDVDILRGTYYLYDYNFAVTEGKVQFLGTSTMDPRVHLVAETRLRVTDVDSESGDTRSDTILLRMTVDGTALNLGQPKFEAFDPESMEPKGYSETDALLALSLGYTERGLATLNQNAQDKALSRLSGMMVSQQLTRRLRDKTDLFDTLNLDTNLFGNEGGSATATVTVGKYISDDIFVSYSQGLPFSHGNKVRVEYSLNSWCTAVGQRKTATDEEENQSDNYIIDMKLKYRF
ncbi:MAG: hypothetical protein B6244_01855 [Candidatus Cloacimonetes bacterium 4572_55]|nr:MAG: hypothetical protein B6244_01855 [Candidatus Cloacimonetes bacterium 4572_55]